MRHDHDVEYLMCFECTLRYTVSILHVDDGKLKIGSGVLFSIEGRLFVASARHCIEHEAVLLTNDMPIPTDSITMPPPVSKMLRKVLDPRLDIGFAELEMDKRLETQIVHCPCDPGQFYLDPIKEKNRIHVTGWPEYETKIAGNRLIQTLEGFITICQRTDTEFLFFPFSKVAEQWNESSAQWENKCIPTPRGFSGAGCWGLVKPQEGELFNPVKHIKLLAIQSCWDRHQRIGKAVLATHLRDLILGAHPEFAKSFGK